MVDQSQQWCIAEQSSATNQRTSPENRQLRSSPATVGEIQDTTGLNTTPKRAAPITEAFDTQLLSMLITSLLANKNTTYLYIQFRLLRRCFRFFDCFTFHQSNSTRLCAPPVSLCHNNFTVTCGYKNPSYNSRKHIFSVRFVDMVARVVIKTNNRQEKLAMNTLTSLPPIPIQSDICRADGTRDSLQSTNEKL